jgi:polygalacturonase
MPTEPIAEIKAPFPMPQLTRPAIPDRSVNIRDFGAKPGKDQDNTKAIRDAIEACAGKGGGSVVIPAGEWYTGAIHYKSNINLHLENGASLYFLPDAKLYLPPVHVRYIGTECMSFSPMLYANHCTNIALTGKGKLYGPGHDTTGKRNWCEWRASRDNLAKAAGVKRGTPGDYTWLQGERLMEDFSKQEPDIMKRDGAGTYAIDPSFFQPMFCENVLVEDIMVARNGPFWTIHPTFCKNVIIRKVALYTRGAATDTISLDSCENVLVEYCDAVSGDDIVAIKSGQDDDGWRAGKPTRNAVVRYVNGMAGNGFSIGSELSGGAENLYFHDCIANASTPCRIKSRPGRGGVIRNITWERIRVGVTGKQYTDWKFPEIWAYEPAKYLIEINNNYVVKRKQIDRTKVTKIEDITVRDVTATTVNTGLRVSNSKNFKNIVIENVQIEKALKGAGGVGSAATVKNYTVGGKPVVMDKSPAGGQEKPDKEEQ